MYRVYIAFKTLCGKSSIGFVLVSIDEIYTHGYNNLFQVLKFLSLSFFCVSRSAVSTLTNDVSISQVQEDNILFGGHSRPVRQLVLNRLDELEDRHLITYRYRRILRRNRHGRVAFHKHLLQNWKKRNRLILIIWFFKLYMYIVHLWTSFWFNSWEIFQGEATTKEIPLMEISKTNSSMRKNYH